MARVVATLTAENREGQVRALKAILQAPTADDEGRVVDNAIAAIGEIDASGSAIPILSRFAGGGEFRTQTRILAVQAIAECAQRVSGSDAMIDLMQQYLTSENALVARQARLSVASARSPKAEITLFGILDKDLAMLPPPDFAVTNENGPRVEALFGAVISDMHALRQLGTKESSIKLRESLEEIRSRYPSGPGHLAVQYLDNEGILSGVQEDPLAAAKAQMPTPATKLNQSVPAQTPAPEALEAAGDAEHQPLRWLVPLAIALAAILGLVLYSLRRSSR